MAGHFLDQDFSANVSTAEYDTPSAAGGTAASHNVSGGR